MISGLFFLSRKLQRTLGGVGVFTFLLFASGRSNGAVIDFLQGEGAIAPGAELSRTFIWPKGKQQPCLIELQARIQAKGIAVGWCNQVVTILLNGKEIAAIR